MNHQPMSANQRFVLALAAIAVLGVGLMKVAPAQQPVPPGANVPDVVNARRFQVVDKNGKIRIELGVEGQNDAEARIRLWNSASRVAATLEIDEANRAHLVLAGPDGKHQAVFTSTPEGPGLLMGTKKGEQPRLHILVDDNGQPHIRLWNTPHHKAAQVTLEPQPTP
jgi:hypothetical protein